MRLDPTPLPGVFVLELEPIPDERGFYARTFDADALTEAGLDATVVHAGSSWNRVAGTLRGLHLQVAPHSEAKTVRCTAGALWDVAVDLRPGSETWGRWFGVELSASNRRALHVPAGCAHGFITLRDDTECHYLLSAAYAPKAARTLAWDDPTVGVEWPRPPAVLSARDRAGEALDAVDLRPLVPGA